jgi:hypothetical protein
MVPHRDRLSENWQLTWCLPHQKVSLRTTRPTQNNQVTPSPSQDRGTGGVALPSARRVVNISSQTSATRRGKPTTLVVGRCHNHTICSARDCSLTTHQSPSLFLFGQSGSKRLTSSRASLTLPPSATPVVRRISLRAPDLVLPA